LPARLNHSQSCQSNSLRFPLGWLDFLRLPICLIFGLKVNNKISIEINQIIL
jgi:hypothetical protein